MEGSYNSSIENHPSLLPGKKENQSENMHISLLKLQRKWTCKPGTTNNDNYYYYF